MPRLSDHALQARRDHILRAAERCFARDGFQAATIADVRAEAGVSTGAIYTYFESKEAMMRAILERARSERTRQLGGAPEEGTSAPDRAAVLLRWVTDIFEAQGQHAARIDVNLWAEALRNPTILNLARDALGQANGAVGDVVRSQLPATGPEATLDPDAVASVLVSLFLGLEIQSALGLPLDRSEIVRSLATFFADYLPRAAPEPRKNRAKRPERSQRGRHK